MARDVWRHADARSGVRSSLQGERGESLSRSIFRLTAADLIAQTIKLWGQSIDDFSPLSRF